MRTNKFLRRLMTMILGIVMAMSLAIPAFAAEIDDSGPDLAAIAAMFADWDGSYELPDLGELSPEDQAIVKAMVDEILMTREAEAENAQVQDEVPLTISFSDVPTSHTFYKGVVYCAGKGIVNGYPDGTFRPATTVAKNHFSAMLARAFYAADVAKYDTESYKKAYGTFGATNYTLAVNGILNDTSFRWKYTNGSVMGTGINRYDMAQMMTNIMAKKGFAASSTQKTAIQSKITDYKNIPSQYRDAVKNVYALGIITGYSDGSFVGNNIMNRGQAAIVIQRMAQYAPVKGDSDNNQYDDGTEQKPSTSNPGTGNNNNAGSSSTGSNTGNTGSSTGSSGNTGTTKPETPAYVLSNGKPITEENVYKLMMELKAKYPEGSLYAPVGTTIYTKIYESFGNANRGVECAGWAALASDYIFGKDGYISTHKNFNNMHPGDVLYNKNHKSVIMYRKTCNVCGSTAYVTSDSSADYVVHWDKWGTLICPHCYASTLKSGSTVITRYPTDVPQYNPKVETPSTGTGSNTGNSSNNTNSSTTDTSVNWVTSSNPCGVCGKTGGRQVRSNDGGRYVCESCWNDPSGIGKWFVE